MGNPPASCTLLCSVCPLPPPATSIWQQQGQQGYTSKGIVNCCWVLGHYLGVSSWTTGGQSGGSGWELYLSTPIAAPWALPAPSCFPDSAALLPRNGATCKSKMPSRYLITFLSRIPLTKISPWPGYTPVSVTCKARGRISQGKVIKICDNALRNPNINSLKNNSNCVR